MNALKRLHGVYNDFASLQHSKADFERKPYSPIASEMALVTVISDISKTKAITTFVNEAIAEIIKLAPE